MKRTYFRGTLTERMEFYTNRTDGCWLWTGTTRKGYGLVWLGGGKQREAHIVAWELEHGEPAGGRVVRHTCDTPRCVRPSHLLIGTHADNVKDKVERGRQAKGSRHGNAKLTETQVEEIRTLLRLGVRQREIARIYKTTQSNISTIKNHGWYT